MKFKVGDRVETFASMNTSGYGKLVLRHDPDYTPHWGIVKSVTPQGLCITWHDAWIRVCHSDDELINPKLVFLASQREEVLSDLEKKFNKIEKEINARVKAAAKEIKAAVKLANKVGWDLSDLDVASPIVEAMDQCGWNSSSWGC